MAVAFSVWSESVLSDNFRPVGLSRRLRTHRNDGTGPTTLALLRRLFVQFTQPKRGSSVPSGHGLCIVNGDKLMFLKCMRLDSFFVDALITDEHNRLLFLSARCRDTVAQEFLAKMTLSTKDDGFLDGVLVFEGDKTIRVILKKEDKFEKRQGKVPGGVFGESLVHLWVFNPICLTPDTANFRAVLLMKAHSDVSNSERLWSIIKTICPAPLLDEWRACVVAAFEKQDWIKPVSGFGLSAVFLDLTNAGVVIRDMVRTGVLTTGDTPTADESSIREKEVTYA